jgi:hypothetical protein
MQKFGLFLVAASVLAACGGGSVARAPLPQVIPTVCPLAVIAPPVMISPTNGASGVPRGNFAIILAYAYGTEITVTVAGAASGTVSAPGVPDPTPGIGQYGSPGIPEDYDVGVLVAATTYTVTGAAPVPAGCTSPVVTIGSFTTS